MVKQISRTELKHSGRRKSIKEGIFASAEGSFGGKFISPFAIAINTSNSLVALLTSITGLLGPLSQLFSSKWFERDSRKKVVLTSVFLEALMWIPFIIIAILFSKGILINFLPALLLLSFSIYIILTNAAQPFWFSWMGDIVDSKYRGRWFSKRNLIIGIISVVLAIFASVLLDYFKKNNLAMLGFGILFFLALVSRLGSWLTFKKQYEPKLKFEKKDYFSFWQFLKQAPNNNFGKFSLFRSLYAFAGAVSGSVWTIYLLRYLKFNYTIYIIVLVSEVVFSLIFVNLWGKLADKYGNYKIIILTTFILPITPILWILNTSPIYMILVPSLIEGIAWGGFILVSKNFIYDNVRKQKRSLAISYYNMLWGIGVFFGAGLAAILIKYLNIKIISPIILIFILGAILKMIVVSLFIPKMKETKKIKVKQKNFEKDIFKGIKPSLVEEVHEIHSIGHYLKE